MKSTPDIPKFFLADIHHAEDDINFSVSNSEVQDQTTQPLLKTDYAESTMATPSDRRDHCAINMPLDTGGMVLPQQSNTSDPDSETQDRTTQDLKKWSTIENLHGDSDDKTSVHAESQAVDDTLEQNLPEHNPDQTFVEKLKVGWKKWSIWDNISISIGSNGPPLGVILLDLSFIVIHIL